MISFNTGRQVKEKRLNIALSSVAESHSYTNIRVRLHISEVYLHEPIISRLISEYGVVVNITGAMLGEKTNQKGYFDLEFRGNVSQIDYALSYLQSLNIKIIGKCNTAGDSWYC